MPTVDELEKIIRDEWWKENDTGPSSANISQEKDEKEFNKIAVKHNSQDLIYREGIPYKNQRMNITLWKENVLKPITEKQLLDSRLETNQTLLYFYCGLFVAQLIFAFLLMRLASP